MEANEKQRRHMINIGIKTYFLTKRRALALVICTIFLIDLFIIIAEILQTSEIAVTLFLCVLCMCFEIGMLAMVIVDYIRTVHFHYEYLPMQYTEIFLALKIENFHLKKKKNLIFTQNIDCWYTFEPPRRCGSNEDPQSMFWSKNKKNRYTPAYPSFAI